MKSDVWLQLTLLITVAVLPPTFFKRPLEKCSLFKAHLAMLSRGVHRSCFSEWDSTLNFHAVQYFVHRMRFFHLNSNTPVLATPDLLLWEDIHPLCHQLFYSLKYYLPLLRIKCSWRSSARWRNPGKEGRQVWWEPENNDIVLVRVLQDGPFRRVLEQWMEQREKEKKKVSMSWTMEKQERFWQDQWT